MELYQALITLDGWTFLAQICNLMIQLVIFKKFLLKPIKQVIADRKAKADSEIADAQKLRTEAEAMKAEYEQNLQNARTEANQIVAAAQKTATARSEEIVGEARAQAAALKQKAEADIAQERKKAALLKAGDSDTIVTGRTVGAPVRVLKNRMSREYVRQEKAGADKMELEKYTLGSLRRAVFEGDTVSGSLMAGQVAGMLHEVRPVADILADLWQGGRQRIAALNTEC